MDNQDYNSWLDPKEFPATKQALEDKDLLLRQLKGIYLRGHNKSGRRFSDLRRQCKDKDFELNPGSDSGHLSD